MNGSLSVSVPSSRRRRSAYGGGMTTPHESAGAVVEVGPVAHGGHCVARLDGRVVFVRHALPGETVRLNVTDTSHDSFWRADAVDVLEPSPDRVAPRCPVSGPGKCGGCDFQHVSLAGQRRLKTPGPGRAAGPAGGRRLGRRGRTGRDPSAPRTAWGGGPGCAIRWTSRGVPVSASTAATRSNRSPPRAARSPIPPPRRGRPELAAGRERLARPSRMPTPASTEVTEHATGRDWRLAVDGFWQVHPGRRRHPGRGGDRRPATRAGGAGVRSLLRGRVVRRRPGRRGRAGPGASSGTGGRSRTPAATCPEQVHSREGRSGCCGRCPKRTDLVVLDPPRTGAGKDVIDAVVARRPRAIAYVACDPAALARDLARAARGGYRPTSIRAFDLFPMTHHLEAVAILHR